MLFFEENVVSQIKLSATRIFYHNNIKMARISKKKRKIVISVVANIHGLKLRILILSALNL